MGPSGEIAESLGFLRAGTCQGPCYSEHGAVLPGQEALETLDDWLFGPRFDPCRVINLI